MKTKWDNLLPRYIHSITIQHPLDLREILFRPVYLSGNIQEEIEENMWYIMLTGTDCLKNVTLESLEKFFADLIQEKERQLGTRQATLYVWLDQQVSQICFNILSGIVTDLPFRCHTRNVPISNIIKEFLEFYQDNPLSYDKITFLKSGDEGYDDDDEDDYDGHGPDFIKDIYVKFLNETAK